MEETGCFIKAEKANVGEGRPLPFFHIEGPNEKMVNQATIKIQTMLMTSMMRNEKTLKSQNDDMGQQIQHLELKASHQTEEADIEDTGISDEKYAWIDKLTRKLVEKETQVEQLTKELEQLKSGTSINEPEESDDDEESDDEEEETISVNMGN